MLKQCDMSVAEMSVLSTVLFQPPLPGDVAAFTYDMWRGDALEQARDEYSKAVESCMEKGWMQIVTAAEHSRQLHALAEAAVARADDGTYAEIGAVDLTAEGYRVFSSVEKVRLGVVANCGVRFVESAQRIEIFGTTEAACCEYAQWYTTEPVGFPGLDGSTALPHEYVFDHMDGPVPIGRWRPNRFEIVANGYMARLHFKARPRAGMNP